MANSSESGIRRTDRSSSVVRKLLRRYVTGITASAILCVWWLPESAAQGTRPAQRSTGGARPAASAPGLPGRTTVTPASGGSVPGTPATSTDSPSNRGSAGRNTVAGDTATSPAPVTVTSGGSEEPSAELKQALAYKPLQKDVVYTTPADDVPDACSISYETAPDGKGWVVRDGNGLLLRRFLDTNGDDAIDTWGYFHDGIEVYRDIDGNHNGKADQYRWYHTGGTRWGLDPSEDGVIEQWKQLSVEEASGELVMAMATNDIARFRRVLLTMDELSALELDEEHHTKIAEQIQGAVKQFK
ncbi:MAG: hypothetical protein Q4C47_08680, partial [Planctomycetia bacterium]|nr:hypothetical protein [Planctomycetia bacterium]